MKTITIDSLARLEGNGGISATIDGKVVTDVKFIQYEGPRLIERLTVGRTPEEVVSFIPRICAICSVSHKLASIRAMENSLSIQISPQVNLLRELMHMGEMVESHALHTYYLSLPDYLGFPNAIAMASDYDLEVKIALEMKEFGNQIIKTLSGRFIHGENPQIGGFGKIPSKEELLWIKSRAIQFMPFVIKTVSLFCEIPYPDFSENDTLLACCKPNDKSYGFWGDEILLSSGETIQGEDYKVLTNEFFVPHSNAKRSRYKGQPYSVGALARITNLGERLSGETGRFFNKYFDERWKKNPLFHNAAQALEICYSFERIPSLIDSILESRQDSQPVDIVAEKGEGTGILEAPRGLLIHHYEISDGLIVNADIITPTAQNAEDIERYCQIAAQRLLDVGEEKDIPQNMEKIVRAFDPCISCSVHMATVDQAPRDNWKSKLETLLKKTEPPVYIGLGKRDNSDDATGLELAFRLGETGRENVLTETTPDIFDRLQEISSDRPLIFFDAIDFKAKPGKIMFLSLEYVMNSSFLSHRLFPFINNQADPEQLKNSYILGIQPQSVASGSEISPAVQKSIDRVIKYLEI